jgi:hypothetical protein
VNPAGAYDPTLAGVRSIGRNTSFGGGIDLDIPLQIGIVGGHMNDTLAVGDSTGDGNKDFELNKGPINDVNNGKMYIEVVNALPLQAGIRLHLLGGSHQSLLMVPQSGAPLLFTAPPVDSQGSVTVPANSTSVIELNQSEVQQFNPAQFMVYDISLDTTPGVQTVRFSSTDNIHIRVWSTLSYRVNK